MAQLSKLKSTYTDALLGCMDPAAGACTPRSRSRRRPPGRLSSSDPNLQNIPIRTEEGRRSAARSSPSPGTSSISADYSQIELRLLAHIADIPQLRQAFADGLDIHAATASAMFGVPLEEVTPDLRRRAKTINFGIIYGISAFGLAERLGIPREEASRVHPPVLRAVPGHPRVHRGHQAALPRRPDT